MRTKAIVQLVAALAIVGCREKPEVPHTSSPAVSEAQKVDGGPSVGDGVSQTEGTPAAGPSLLPLGSAEARIRVKPPAQVRYNQAKKALKAGDRPEAIRLLEESLAEDPSFPWAILLRARMHREENQKKECLDLLERLLAVNYIQFAPQIQRLAWLKPLREDPDWKTFEARMEAYREAWVEALAGPGAFFIESQFRKLEGSDLEGEPLDLRWVRGSPVFWSRPLDRYLVVGEFTDVAGFLVDRKNSSLVLVRWLPADEPVAGLMGKVLVHRIDLGLASSAPRSIEIAEQVAVVMLALDEDGSLLYSLAGDVEQDAPSSGDDEEAAADGAVAAGVESGEEDDEGDHVEAEAEVEDEAGNETGDGGEEEGEDGDEEEPEGQVVGRVDWASGKTGEGVLDPSTEWQLTLTLGRAQGPAPESLVDRDEDLPRPRHGGACFWLDQASALCIEPTKKGGTWHNLVLHESGADPVVLNAEPVPVAQY